MLKDYLKIAKKIYAAVSIGVEHLQQGFKSSDGDRVISDEYSSVLPKKLKFFPRGKFDEKFKSLVQTNGPVAPQGDSCGLSHGLKTLLRCFPQKRTKPVT